MKEGVFIAMPVFRGTDVIEETLRSILAQTYTDFHLVMSIDGSDDPTVELCRRYENDSRIDVVVQDPRLGWPRNFNWLVENCDREFFCYWQQDDLASTGYIESLRKELLARPDASITYTDVQWFGARFDRNSSPSIEGDPLSRVIQHIEAIRYEPLRGLMRASMFPTNEPAIPVTEDESCQEEFVFLTRMAMAGAFIRVDSAMYFKRLHGTNVFTRWARFPEWRRRRGWISMGAGMYSIARHLAPEDLRPRVLRQVLDRLAVERHGRAHFFSPEQNPDELQRFVRDFVSYADIPVEDLGLPGDRSEPLDRPVHPDILRSLQAERETADQRSNLRHRLEKGETMIEVGRDELTPVLGYGWSIPEEWGVWTDGEAATLRLPLASGRAWRIQLEGRPFPEPGPVRVGHVFGSGDLVYHILRPGEILELPLEWTGRSEDSETVLRLHLPDASSPREAGVSSDKRQLGFGLAGLTINAI